MNQMSAKYAQADSPVRNELVIFAALASVLGLVSCGGSGDDGGGTTAAGGSAVRLGYEANWLSGNVSGFRINADGTLTSLAMPIAAGTHPHNITVDPAARFVYVSNHESNFLSGYTINSTTGVLTPVVGPLTAGGSPHAAAFDKTGRFLYVINGLPGTTPTSMITAYSVNANGTLTGLGSAFPTGQHSHNLTVDPSNRFIYVASEISNDIFAFAINSTTGVLVPIPGSPFGGTSGPLAVAIDQASKFAYVSNSGGEVQAFAIDSMTGALTPLSPTFVFSGGGAYAHSIVFDSTQNFLYTGNINSNNVSAYQVNHTTGVLAIIPGSPFGTGNQPEYVTSHPTLGFLYVSNFGDHNISRFSINPTTGQLNPAGVFSDPSAAAGAVSGPISLEMTGS